MQDPENIAPGSATPGSAAPQCGNCGDKSVESGAVESRAVESRTGVRRSQTHSPETHRGWYSRGYLPHFDSPDVLQHITYRLADSLPRAVLEQMQAEVEALVQEDEKRKTEMRRR